MEIESGGSRSPSSHETTTPPETITIQETITPAAEIAAAQETRTPVWSDIVQETTIPLEILASSESFLSSTQTRKGFIAVLLSCLWNNASATILSRDLMAEVAAKVESPCVASFGAEEWTFIMNDKSTMINGESSFDMHKQQKLDDLIRDWILDLPEPRHYSLVTDEIQDLINLKATTNSWFSMVCTAIMSAILAVWAYELRWIDFFGSFFAGILLSLLLGTPSIAESVSYVYHIMVIKWRKIIIMVKKSSKNNKLIKTILGIWKCKRGSHEIFADFQDGSSGQSTTSVVSQKVMKGSNAIINALVFSFKVVSQPLSSHSTFAGPFVFVFVIQLFLLWDDPNGSKHATHCNLYDVAEGYKFFCNPILQLGSPLALLLPGFALIIGAFETVNGHYTAGIGRISIAMIRFLGLCMAVSSASLLSGMIVVLNTQEFKITGPSPPVNGYSNPSAFNATISGLMLSKQNHDMGGGMAQRSWLFETIPMDDNMDILWGTAFSAFATSAFNGVTFERKWPFVHGHFARQMFIAIMAPVLRTKVYSQWEAFENLPRLIRYLIDGTTLGFLVALCALLHMIYRWITKQPGPKFRRPHLSVAYPALFAALPFSLLLPIFGNLADHRLYGFMMAEGTIPSHLVQDLETW